MTDMGLGKTYTGSEKLMQLGANVNLVICQKSKVNDWIEHFEKNYDDILAYDLTKKSCFDYFMNAECKRVGIINYELAFRRLELAKLKDFTLLLDESSLIQNEQARRSKFILNKLKPKNIILLSGTPTSGRYERLWSQMQLLGWDISKDLYWKQYVDFYYLEGQGFPIKVVRGYKNTERLKQKMSKYGCRFLKTDEVMDLPEQVFQKVYVEPIKEYKKFHKSGIIDIGGETLVGDTTLTKMLYERQLCGIYNQDKIEALRDILESTNDRVIVFYNFNEELYKIEDLCIQLDRPTSIINGKEKDLRCYDEFDNSVTLVQYQAGALGINLQKANRLVYFTPTLSCENYMQSQKRIHRIGQHGTCFYYELICKGSIEERIYNALATGVDYTNYLFEKGD